MECGRGGGEPENVGKIYTYLLIPSILRRISRSRKERENQLHGSSLNPQMN